MLTYAKEDMALPLKCLITFKIINIYLHHSYFSFHIVLPLKLKIYPNAKVTRNADLGAT